MGLDLFLYAVKPEPGVNHILEELCYGRKTWGIAEYFISQKDTTEIEANWYNIPKTVWDEFVKKVDQYATHKEFMDFLKTLGDTENLGEIDAQVLKRFLENVLNYYEIPEISMVWEIKMAIEWYWADAEVQKCYDEDLSVHLHLWY